MCDFLHLFGRDLFVIYIDLFKSFKELTNAGSALADLSRFSLKQRRQVCAIYQIFSFIIEKESPLLARASGHTTGAGRFHSETLGQWKSPTYFEYIRIPRAQLELHCH